MSRSTLIVAAWFALSAGSIAAAAADVTYSGKVVDEAGAPLAGVKVRVFHVQARSAMDFAVDEGDSVTTDADGRFSVAGIAQQTIVVAQQERLALGWALFHTAMPIAGDSVTITLGKPETMAGVVLDKTGTPVEGAVVRGFFVAGTMEQMRYIIGWDPIDAVIRKTDAKGKFSFDDLPADVKGDFIVSAPGHASLSTYQTGQMPGQYAIGKTDIRLVLAPEGRVEGKVIDKATGEPVAGVKIKAVAANNPLTFDEPVISDAQGKFAIGGLTSVGHRLHATPDPVKHAGLVAGEAIVDVMGGQTTSDVVIELFKGGVLEVVVTDEKDGSPVKTAHVQVTSDGGRQPVGRTTDDKGVASISLAPGDYTVQMVYAMPLYGMSQPNESVTVEAGKTERVEVKLAPAPKVTGTVRDPDGKPVEGAVLQVMPMGHRMFTSDAQGKFEIGLQPMGWGGQDMAFVLVARHADRDLAVAVEIDPDATDPLDVKLEPGTTIFGKVRNAKDEPIANATVQVMLRTSNYSSPLTRGQAATTDADGLFEARALPSDQKIQLTATAPDFGQTQVEVDLVDVADRRVEAPQMTLQPANMSIAGTVVDEDDKPMSGAAVHVFGDGQAFRQAQTDKEGKFTIEKLCEGSVQISVSVQTPTHMSANVSAQAGDTDVKVVVVDQSAGQRVVVPPVVRSLVGKPLPGLGKLNVNVTAKDLEGKAVLVGFFDLRQRPSRHFLKKLAAKVAALEEQGLAVIVVHAAPIEADQLKAMLAKLGVDIPMGVIQDDAEKTRAAWAVQGLPWFILADTKHVVRADDFAFTELDAKLEAIAR